jgi:hypothetical protein
MEWLRDTALATALLLAACSNGDSSSGPTTPLPEASQPPPTKFEAGAPCLTSNDCQSGLSCLFPAGGGCSAFSVCTASPPDPCDHPQTACSCLVENVPVCDGYALDRIDSMGPCSDVVVPPVDASVDAGGVNAGGGVDATVHPDAAGSTGDAGDAQVD